MFSKAFIDKKLVFIFLLSIFLFLPQFIDVDFWWHLRLGNEIVDGNWHNNLTYTCLNYYWINHSWLTDYLYGLIHNYTLLAFINATVIATGVYFIYKCVLLITNRTKSYLLYAVTIISSLVLIFRYLSIRPHLISFVLTAIVSYLILKIIYKGVFRKKDYLLFFILFLLWANLHGGFIIGIAIIGFLTFLNFCQYVFYSRKVSTEVDFYKNNFISLLKILLISLAVTLINPFGVNLWLEVFRNIFINQGDYISEWKPFIFNSVNDYVLLAFLGLILFLHTTSKRKYWYMSSLFSISFVLTLFSGRYLLFSTIFIIILFTSLLSARLPKFEINKTERRNIILLTSIFYITILSSIIWSFNLTRNTFNNLEETQKTPINAIDYLKDNLADFNGNFYNDYELGGYLEYRVPEIKWFADGRMAVWSCESEVDSKRIFMNDILEIYFGNNEWKEHLNSYEIKNIFTKKNSRLSQLIKIDGGWELKYEDKYVVIFTR